MQSILDNRSIPPVGSMVATKDGVSHLLMFGQIPGQLRRLAMSYAGTQEKPSGFNVMPDITKPDYLTKEMKISRDSIDPEFFKSIDNNLVTNLRAFRKNPTYEREKTVALVAAGQVEEEDIAMLEKAGVPIVAVNSAIKKCKPKYWVGIDSRSNLRDYVKDIDVSGVRAYLYAGVHPAVGLANWKDVGWFSTIGGLIREDQGPPNIPMQFDSEGVIGQAIQFIYRELKAEKIILLGVQHPVWWDFAYFWIGIALQGICFWYSRAGVYIWNCTKESSIVSGVILGPLEAALAIPVRKLGGKDEQVQAQS